MERWVKLRTGEAQLYDRRIGFHVRRGEKKPLPDPLPADSLTARRYDMGCLVDCDPPASVVGAGLKPGPKEEAPHPDPLPEREREAEEAAEAVETPDAGADLKLDLTGNAGFDEAAVAGWLGEDSPPLAPQPEEAPAEEEVPATVEELAGARDTVIERRIETLLAEHKRAELREMAKALGLSMPATAKNRTIAAEIAVAEWQREHGK